MGTIDRDALVVQLQGRRRNDVRVAVRDGDSTILLDIRGVRYDTLADVILITTEPWWGTPRPAEGGE